MNSIRRSLVVGSVLGVTVVFSLSGVAVYRGARSTLVRQLDERLEEQARVIASVARRTPGGMEIEVEDLDIPDFTSTGGHGYLELWLDADRVLYRSPRLEGHDLPAPGLPELDRPVFRWIRIGAGGVDARAIDLRTEAVADSEDWAQAHQTAPAAAPIRLVAAVEARSIDSFLARLRVLLVTVGSLGSVAVAVVLALVIGRSLRPLDELAHEIGGVGDEDLSRRMQVPAAPREMEPVVRQLNQLLARLEDSFRHERTFTSDIAHELRTPLSGLRSTIEVATLRSRTEGEYRETLDDLLAIVRRMQAMVETLLYLGRLESGQVEVEQRVVDLSELTGDTWRTLSARARERGATVVLALPVGVSVTADPVLLDVAIRNILDNAAAYVDPGGSIRIDVVTEGGEGRLRVANTGSHIAGERVEEILRRFTRADPSRAASADHFGLGLALTTKITSALHGRIDVQSRLGGEFVVTLALPGA